MAGGPDDAVKRASVEKDASFDIYETWTHLGKNFLIVAIVATMTWGLVSVLRYGIEIGSEFLFEPFAEIHAEAGEHGDAAAASALSGESVAEEVQEAAEEAREAVEEAISGEGHGEGAEGEHETDLGTHIWVIMAVLMGGALLRGLLLQIPSWKSSEGDGMGTSLEYFHQTYDHSEPGHQPRFEKPSILEALRRMVLTILTVGTGGSGGIEAPVVPIGENIGAWISQKWHGIFGEMTPDDLRIYQIAGISAAVATLLDAPFTAALFAAEVVYNGRILYRTMMYSLVGAIVAFALNNHFLDFEPLFNPEAHAFSYTLLEYLEVTIVAVICSAPAGIGVGWLFKKLKYAMKPVPGIARPILGAIGVGAIALALWFGLEIEPQHVMGVSEETIIQVMLGEGNPLLSVWWVLLLLVVAKAFATGFTLMGGGSAGALVPSMFMGAVFGAAIFHFLTGIGYETDANVSIFVVAGLASALVAVVSVPLAAVAFVMEVFGAHFGPPAIVACVVTYMLARRWKLYSLPTMQNTDAAPDEEPDAEKKS